MSALAPLQMPFAVGLSSRFSMISSLRILHRPLPCPHRCRGWLQRWCAPHLAFRCTRPPIWGLPRMITWRWACGTTRHSPISAAAFLRIRCAHYWLFAGRAAGAGHPDLCVLPGTADPVFQHPCFRKRVAICSNRAAGIIFTSVAIIILQRRQLWLAAAFGCLMAFYLNLV